jgi:L-serine dehydratase
MQHKISLLDLVTSEIVGPSSSHTAGAMRLGLKVYQRVKDIDSVKIILYNSLADTGDAHMTKSALVAGLLGFKETDPRIPFSFEYAQDKNIKIEWHHVINENYHPNTVFFAITDKQNKKRYFTGTSVGGGRIKFKEVASL